MRRTFDVDIDVKGGVERSEWGVRCSIYDEDSKRLSPHPSGVIIEDVPTDPITGLSCIDYKECDRLGLYKVDILTNTSYNIFESHEEMEKYRDSSTNWELLLDESVCKSLPHIANHYDIVKLIKPKSVEELAHVLALVRPGKKHLLDDYMNPVKKKLTINNIFRDTKDGMYFKKSHAISYAVMIVTVLNKLQTTMIMYGKG